MAIKERDSRGRKGKTREEIRRNAMSKMAQRRTLRDLTNPDEDDPSYHLANANMTKKPEREMLANSLHWFYQSLQPPPQTDQEWAERIAGFFDRCFETGEALIWEKFCLAMGYTSDGIRDILIGKTQVTPMASALLKKSKEIFAQIDAEMALKYKYNSAVYIFRSKNYYGTKTDKQLEDESAEGTRDPLAVMGDLDNLRDKYIKDVTDSVESDA